MRKIIIIICSILVIIFGFYLFSNYDYVWYRITGDDIRGQRFIEIADNTKLVQLFLEKYPSAVVETYPYIMKHVSYHVYNNSSSYHLIVSLNLSGEVTGFSASCINSNSHYNTNIEEHIINDIKKDIFNNYCMI